MTHHNSNYDDLLVDFPSNNSPSIVLDKNVTFSITAQGRYIDYPSLQENKEKWYSLKDEEKFRRKATRDAIKCSIILAAARDKDDALKQACLVLCTGLDHLISNDVPQRQHALKEARREHVKVVLHEQYRQRCNNAVSHTDLARVSKESSERFRTRAHEKINMLNGASSGVREKE